MLNAMIFAMLNAMIFLNFLLLQMRSWFWDSSYHPNVQWTEHLVLRHIRRIIKHLAARLTKNTGCRITFHIKQLESRDALFAALTHPVTQAVWKNTCNVPRQSHFSLPHLTDKTKIMCVFLNTYRMLRAYTNSGKKLKLMLILREYCLQIFRSHSYIVKWFFFYIGYLNR